MAKLLKNHSFGSFQKNRVSFPTKDTSNVGYSSNLFTASKLSLLPKRNSLFQSEKRALAFRRFCSPSQQPRTERKVQETPKESVLREEITISPKDNTKLGNEPEKADTRKLTKREDVLEKGLIYFFYRLKVGVEEAHSLQDVQKLYVLLAPGSETSDTLQREAGKKYKHPERLMILSKKKMPPVNLDEKSKQHERFWGFVQRVSDRVEDIDENLKGSDYLTKKRGEVRHMEGARPVAEGVYALVTAHNHTHLAYVLELPQELSEVQKAFGIAKEGSYILQVKNPELKGDFLGNKKAAYPPELMKLFSSEKTNHSIKYTSATPELLDYEGSEFVIVGTSDDLKSDLGSTGKYIEDLEKLDASKITDEKLWNELKLDKAKHPAEPLLKGQWK